MSLSVNEVQLSAVDISKNVEYIDWRNNHAWIAGSLLCPPGLFMFLGI